MVTPPPAKARAPRAARKQPAEPPKSRGKKGAQPAKKATKRASAGRKRAPTGPQRTPGEQLRLDLGRDGDPVGITVLIRQAGRTLDRLEQIDAVLKGDEATWLKLSLPRSDAKRGRVYVEVKVDGLLVEERNLSNLLRHYLREIDRQRGNSGNGGGDDEDDDLVD